MRKIISPRQEEVLKAMASSYTGVLFRPIHTLERLQKKGLVVGNKRKGWRLTPKGEAWSALFGKVKASGAASGDALTK